MLGSGSESGTNAAVRSARHQITNDGTGTKKGVEITVELAPNVHMDALAPMSAGALVAGE